MDNVTVTPESFDSLASCWLNPRYPLRWDCIFVLPPWLEVWWRESDSRAESYLCAVRQQETIIGIAPLLLEGEEAFFMGSTDVCDYLDFIVASGSEHVFFNTLLHDLRQKGVRRLDLKLVRLDSIVLTHLVDIARDRGYEVSCRVEDVSLELDLPTTWEEYLEMLTAKQRHEIKRKLRRLGETGEVNYRIIEDSEAVPDAIDIFLKLFRESREDKKIFMTAQRESFFRSMAKAMTQARLLKSGILELDALPVAAIMCFDYNNTMYLYNSGYDPQYSSLSIGLMSKVLCIKDSIERGRRKFDFLKGGEQYKYHLGGREVPLFNCQITFK